MNGAQPEISLTQLESFLRTAQERGSLPAELRTSGSIPYNLDLPVLFQCSQEGVLHYGLRLALADYHFSTPIGAGAVFKITESLGPLAGERGINASVNERVVELSFPAHKISGTPSEDSAFLIAGIRGVHSFLSKFLSPDDTPGSSQIIPGNRMMEAALENKIGGSAFRDWRTMLQGKAVLEGTSPHYVILNIPFEAVPPSTSRLRDQVEAEANERLQASVGLKSLELGGPDDKAIYYWRIEMDMPEGSRARVGAIDRLAERVTQNLAWLRFENPISWHDQHRPPPPK